MTYICTLTGLFSFLVIKVFFWYFVLFCNGLEFANNTGRVNVNEKLVTLYFIKHGNPEIKIFILICSRKVDVWFFK